MLNAIDRVLGRLLSVPFTKYLGNQIEKYEMGGACSAYGGQENDRGFCGGKLRERDLSVARRIILKLIFKKWDRELWTGLVCLRMRTYGGRS
jgi:hypothetical protein